MTLTFAKGACPKCSGEMRLLPPYKHTGVLAYAGGELTFWIVAAPIGGAISCAVDRQYGLSYFFGAIAAIFVAVLIYRAGERGKRGPGLLYCEKCRYYRSLEGSTNPP